MNDLDFYDVTEIFEDLDKETIDLFNRKNFDIEDIENLKELKRNLQDLEQEINIKIDEIYYNFINF